MKIKNAALNSLFYFLYMFGACVVCMVVEALLVFIVEKFVPIPYPVVTVIRIVIYSAGVSVLMAAIGYYEGYREGYCSVPEMLTGGTLAIVFHFILSLLFNFQAFVAGSVRFTAGLIAHGMHVTDDLLSKETPFGLTLIIFLIYGIAYIGILTLGRYFGAQKRIIDRAELRKNE